MKPSLRTYKATPESVGQPSREVSAALGMPWRGPGMPRLVMGRREWVSLPDLGVSPVRAKTDSGAWNSSLHAEEVTLSENEEMVRFITINHFGQRHACEAAVARIGWVRSSTGVSRQRIFIHTTLELVGGLKLNVVVSLVNRKKMLCPMLLGRRALSGFFLIDPQAAYLLGPRGGLERDR